MKKTISVLAIALSLGACSHDPDQAQTSTPNPDAAAEQALMDATCFALESGSTPDTMVSGNEPADVIEVMDRAIQVQCPEFSEYTFDMSLWELAE